MLRGLPVLGITALGSAVFWAPLAWNILTAPKVESLNNRWLTGDSGDLALPMLDPTVLGALCLAGLVFLLVTFREPVSRSLLVVLAVLYLWHAIGYLALVAEAPLLSFRMKAGSAMVCWFTPSLTTSSRTAPWPATSTCRPG